MLILLFKSTFIHFDRICRRINCKKLPSNLFCINCINIGNRNERRERQRGRQRDRQDRQRDRQVDRQDRRPARRQLRRRMQADQPDRDRRNPDPRKLFFCRKATL